MKNILFLSFITISFGGFTQDNCNAFLLQGDSCRYKACDYIQKAPGFYQLTGKFQEIFDHALEICPDYAKIYRSKSVGYLKTGDFLNWKKLMDKAVELNPSKFLDYRGWCRFQFFRDYEGAIKDIERLEDLFEGNDIGFSQNGDYHLLMAKALCYKKLDEKEKALSIMEKYLSSDSYQMPYDYLHLGVLYLELEQYDFALGALYKQSEYNDLADNQFYIAKAHQALGNRSKALQALEKAKNLYAQQRFMYDVYAHPVDKVFLGQIEEELEVIIGG